MAIEQLCNSCGNTIYIRSDGTYLCSGYSVQVCDKCYKHYENCNCNGDIGDGAVGSPCPYCYSENCHGECQNCQNCGSPGCNGECENLSGPLCGYCGSDSHVSEECPYYSPGDFVEPTYCSKCGSGDHTDDECTLIWCDNCSIYTDHTTEECPYKITEEACPRCGEFIKDANGYYKGCLCLADIHYWLDENTEIGYIGKDGYTEYSVPGFNEVETDAGIIDISNDTEGYTNLKWISGIAGPGANIQEDWTGWSGILDPFWWTSEISTSRGFTSFMMDGSLHGRLDLLLRKTPIRYQIIYNLNGGSVDPSYTFDKSFDYNQQDCYLIPESKISRPGYVFNGWKDSNGNYWDEYIEVWKSTSENTSGAIDGNNKLHLTADWKKLFAIRYISNGGDFTQLSQSKIEGIPTKITTRIPLKNNTSNIVTGNFTLTGNANGGHFKNSSATSTSIRAESTRTDTTSYTFAYWTTNEDGTGTKYYPNNTYSIDANLTLYAQYSTKTTQGTTTYSNNKLSDLPAVDRDIQVVATYTITFNGNGVSVSPTTQTASKYTTYEFLGWANNATDTTPTASSEHYSNKTVYACWKGTTGSAKMTLPDLTRDGYKFLGWATSATATSGLTGTYTATSNVTLYAIWEPLATIFTKVSGSYKAGSPYVKVNGSWKKGTAVYVKVNGIWKQSTR